MAESLATDDNRDSLSVASLPNIWGCDDNQTQPVQDSPDIKTVDYESPSWQAVSISHEDYGIVYDDLEDFGQFPFDKLVAYYLNSDGVYAEGSGDELYRRFLEAPNIVLTYIALIGNNSVRGDVLARTALCSAIASANVFWYDNEASFNTLLERFETIYSSGSVADVLVCLRDEYEAAIERNK